MTTFSNRLRRFVETSRGKGALPPAAARDAIGVAISEGRNSGTAIGSQGGFVSPWVEQEYTGNTFYQLVSSDGFFVFEFGDQTELIDDDGTGSSFVVKHDDPST